MKPYRDHIRTMLFILLMWVAFIYARQGCPSATEIAEAARGNRDDVPEQSTDSIALADD